MCASPHLFDLIPVVDYEHGGNACDSGPAILSLLFVGGLVLASVSAFSALLVSMLIVPVIAVTLVAFTSAASGIAFIASAAAIIAGVWIVGVSGFLETCSSSLFCSLAHSTPLMSIWSTQSLLHAAFTKWMLER